MQNQSVKLTVDHKNLLHSLKFAFAGRGSVIGELLQNTRRSGASTINIHYKDETLMIVDNGCGINDFQTLLTVAQSGWNEELQNKEKPYGLGFLSAIYSAQSCTVISNGHRIDFNTDELLDQQDVIIKKVNAFKGIKGTKVILNGI